MTKAQVDLLKTQFYATATNATTGKKDRIANQMIVVFDNDHTFHSNLEPIIWDETNELVYTIRANTDKYTNAESPFRIIAGPMVNIYYFEGYYDYNGLLSMLATLKTATLVNDAQIEAIKDWAMEIHNSPLQPNRATPYYATDATAITRAPTIINRTDVAVNADSGNVVIEEKV